MEEVQFKLVKIKGQVLLKREKNAKLGWGHLKIFSKSTEPEKLRFA
jgi:hypothetical protein